MASNELKSRLQSDMKAAMKSGDKPRLAVIRQMQAAIKQVEVDERIEVDDARVTSILDKMGKQRRESISQFSKAARQDLIEIEEAELKVIHDYLPAALSDAEIEKLIVEAMEKSGARDIKQMGQVMGLLKPQLQGRADMAKVSQLIKSRLM